MILPAVDYQKIYLEKNYPEILKKISEMIDKNVDIGYCLVEFSKEEENNINAFESYLERLGFEVRLVYRSQKHFLEIIWI